MPSIIPRGSLPLPLQAPSFIFLASPDVTLQWDFLPGGGEYVEHYLDPPIDLMHNLVLCLLMTSSVLHLVTPLPLTSNLENMVHISWSLMGSHALLSGE